MNGMLSRLNRVAGELARLPDTELLAAFLDARCDAAFEALVRRHGSMVFAVCRRVLRHQQDAEDAFQATFLVLARRAADVWPRDAVGSWLYGVAYRVALKARAARARRNFREQPLNGTDRAAPEVPIPDLADVVVRLVQRLPEVYRAAVVACDLEGLSRKDAAARLGWKEGTLSGRLARARQLLAKRLRRMGLTLPAGGIAVALGAGEVGGGVSGELIAVTIRTAALCGKNLAAGVSAPVAALTEGVVRGMFLTKAKAALVAVMAACALGFGMWSLAGAGDGPGPGNGAGKGEVGDGQPTSAVQPPARAPTDLERMQGKWRVVTEADREGSRVIDPKSRSDARPGLIEIVGDKMYVPYLHPGEGVKTVEMTITLDPGKNPKQIDVTYGGGVKQPGIYDFPEPRPKGTTVQLRIVLAPPPGPRPVGFGRQDGEGVIEYGLVRVQDGKPSAAPAGPQVEQARAEIKELRRTIEELAKQGKVDPDSIARLRMRVDALEKALVDSKQPPGSKPGTPPADDLIKEARLRQLVEIQHAQIQVREAEARLEQAKAQAALAAADLELAKSLLEQTRAKLAYLEKEAKEAKPPAVKPKLSITVHVRTQTAPEEVIWTEIGETDTVLDALTKAGDAVPLIRGPDALSVWVLRDKEVLPVDLNAIVNRMEKVTNYRLRNGDRVFVQVKPGK